MILSVVIGSTHLKLLVVYTILILQVYQCSLEFETGAVTGDVGGQQSHIAVVYVYGECTKWFGV